MRITIDEAYASSVLVGLVSPWTPDGLTSWAKGLGRSGAALIGPPGVPAPPATGTPLDDSIEAWREHLLAKRRKPTNVRAQVNRLRRAALTAGWTTLEDLTFEAVSAYLGSRTEIAPATYGWMVSNFKSFARWVHQTGRAGENSLTFLEGLGVASGVGTRAATTEEARRLLEHAAGANTDRRAKGCRALYWASLFLAGARRSEPAAWQWRDLLLDETPAMLLWRPEIQKNGQRAELVLAPELGELLRVWRDHLAALGEAVHDEAPVFRVPPSHGTFAKDRDVLGIPEKDSRGRLFAHHSARKWHSTTLTNAGVAPRLVDRLMRHAGRAEDRYYDALPAEQLAALEQLPRIWPEAHPLGAILTDQAASPGAYSRWASQREPTHPGQPTAAQHSPGFALVRPGAQWRMLEALLRLGRGHEITTGDLATAAGLEPTGGHVYTALTALRKLGLVEGPDQGIVRATSAVFAEGKG